MAIAERIEQYVEKMPASFRTEVLHFVEYLLAKSEDEATRREETDWSQLSLAAARRGMENEDGPTYATSDLKVVF